MAPSPGTVSVPVRSPLAHSKCAIHVQSQEAVRALSRKVSASVLVISYGTATGSTRHPLDWASWTAFGSTGLPTARGCWASRSISTSRNSGGSPQGAFSTIPGGGGRRSTTSTAMSVIVTLRSACRACRVTRTCPWSAIAPSAR
ncbi:hypothetical protein ACFQV2_13240 [Actinokineospora soli]|uniref:Uncharacterized protein n=1 Tax=Actinokineospora soli TaxID=1048753 RepID=A0ABW2TLU8_9PSEU